MSSIPFAHIEIAVLKKALRAVYPEISSSHLSEALASALGFRTHASLLAAVPTDTVEPHYVLLDDEAFDARLVALGHQSDPEFNFDFLRVPSLLRTTGGSAWDIEYKSLRDRAWRNLIVETVNEGLRRRMFTLKPDDNRWDGWSGPRAPDSVGSTVFEFTLGNGLPALAYVADAGFAELAIHVAVAPTPRGRDFVRAHGAGFAAGDAFATTWLERENGAWIQTSLSQFKCRKALLPMLAEMEVRPMGYGDRGRVIM